MKVGLPLYEGDSLFHYALGERMIARATAETTVSENASTEKASVAGAADAHQAAGNYTLDLAAVEARARAIRAEYVQKLVHAFVARVRGALKSLLQNETEAYLSQSKNLEELEDRLRQLEREGRLLHI